MKNRENPHSCRERERERGIFLKKGGSFYLAGFSLSTVKEEVD